MFMGWFPLEWEEDASCCCDAPAKAAADIPAVAAATTVAASTSRRVAVTEEEGAFIRFSSRGMVGRLDPWDTLPPDSPCPKFIGVNRR